MTKDGVGAIHRAQGKTAEVMRRKIQSRLLIKQQQGQEISELNTAGDLERIRKVYMIALLLFFPRCLLMATARDCLLGWTNHNSALVQPVLMWEKDQHSLGCMDAPARQADSAAAGFLPSSSNGKE